MKQFYLYLLMVIGIVFLNGCSKDDDNPVKTETEVVLPKEVYRMKIVEVKLSQELSQEEYDGMLGDTPIKLLRADEEKLLFYIPEEFTLGETNLTISQLSVSTRLNVKNPELKGSAEIVLQSVFEKTTPDYQGITTPEYVGNLTVVNTAFKDYYQTLSQEEKNNMALFYQVNESFFAPILDLNFQNKDLVDEVYERILKHQKAIIAIRGGFFVVGLGFIISQPIVMGVGAAIIIAGVYKALENDGHLAENYTLVIDEFKKELFKEKHFSKMSRSEDFVFVNQNIRNVDLFVNRRNMIASDRNSKEVGLVTFFKAHDMLNSIVTDINDKITKRKNSFFFSKIPLIPLSEIATTAESETVPLTEETFSYMKFNVADPNVQITDTKFVNGTIRMEMTVRDLNLVTGNSISTQLNYTYQEEFNNISGSFPIEIKLEETIRLTDIWHFKHYTKNTDGSMVLRYIVEIDFKDGSDTKGQIIRSFDCGNCGDTVLGPSPNIEGGSGWYNNYPYNNRDSFCTQWFNSAASTINLSFNLSNFSIPLNYDPQNPNLLIDQQNNFERRELVKQ